MRVASVASFSNRSEHVHAYSVQHSSKMNLPMAVRSSSLLCAARNLTFIGHFQLGTPRPTPFLRITNMLLSPFGPGKLLSPFGPGKLLSPFGPDMLLSPFGPGRLLSLFGPGRLLSLFGPGKLLSPFGPGANFG